MKVRTCNSELTRRFIFFWFFSSILAQGPYRSLGDIFQGQLAGLTVQPKTGRSPSLGGQDSAHCCLLAVNESLVIENGDLIFKPGQTALRGNVSSFLRYQFPCGAKFNGSLGDQPQVWKSYSWCHEKCSGWKMSSTSQLGAWVQPFIQYIAPAIIFVLSVPRRRRLNLPDTLFPRKINTLQGTTGIIWKVPAASIIVTADTIVWLFVVLAVAGPVLLSGCYEALLDLRLLNFLDDPTQAKRMSVQERAQVLFAILLGNLDQEPAWEDLVRVTECLPNEMVQQSTCSKARTQGRPSRNGKPALKASPEGRPILPGNSSRNSKPHANCDNGLARHNDYDAATQQKISAIKAKLGSMLQCQSSFGSAVGAPIVFFTGSFIYTLIEIQSSYGDNNTSHHLAFGTFWMIVPHTAVVSSLLLAGNNPNVWVGITSQPEALRAEELAQQEQTREQNQHKHIYRPTYDSKYQPAWIWDRGSVKALWAAKLAEAHPHRNGPNLSDVLSMGFRGYVLYTTVPAAILLLVPSLFGGIVSYSTPIIGLSCRSLTFLFYVLAQGVLILLWLWDWRYWSYWKRSPDGKVKIQEAKKPEISPKIVVWYALFAVAIIVTVTMSVGGTMFALMGLFGNCLCFIPMQYWWHRYTDPGAQYYLGNASSEQVYYAQHFWFPLGIAATMFLIGVTYLGWWYQRHLRTQFLELVEGIDKVIDDEDDLSVEDESVHEGEPCMKAAEEGRAGSKATTPHVV